MRICCLSISRSLLAGLLLSVAVSAQAERYELGLRLRAFERHLDDVTDAKLRTAACGELDRAVQAFFRLDTSAVAKAVDAADCALTGKPWSDAVWYAHSMQVVLEERLVARGDGVVRGKLSAAYKLDDEVPALADCSLQLLLPGMAKPLIVEIDELPQAIELPLQGVPVGDHSLQWSIVRGEEVLVTREQGLSVAADLEARLLRVVAAADAVESLLPETIETKTLPALVKLLQGMQRRRSAETILPGAQMLAEAEALAAWFAKPTREPFYGGHRPGSFALRVPVGKSTIAVRLMVPEVSKPAPLVVALHGAGGSENLFFDGYGDGRVVRLGAERNWLVVAPRLTLGSLDVAELVRALAERFPIDAQQVMVVGHSMGAMQAVANAARTPEKFRAVAALGGGGRVRASRALQQLPFFVGVGSKDFALAGAKALHQALVSADVASTLREYAGVEHLAIVQLALDDVFGFFDVVIKASAAGK